MNINMPNDRNLSNTEINKYVDDLDECIKKELHKNTPLHEKYDSLNRYSNPQIKKLQIIKNKLLSEIHRHKNGHNQNKHNIEHYKNVLKIVKKQLLLKRL